MRPNPISNGSEELSWSWHSPGQGVPGWELHFGIDSEQKWPPEIRALAGTRWEKQTWELPIFVDVIALFYQRVRAGCGESPDQKSLDFFYFMAW